jgi:hypothetical protein
MAALSPTLEDIDVEVVSLSEELKKLQKDLVKANASRTPNQSAVYGSCYLKPTTDNFVADTSTITVLAIEERIKNTTVKVPRKNVCVNILFVLTFFFF